LFDLHAPTHPEAEPRPYAAVLYSCYGSTPRLVWIYDESAMEFSVEWRGNRETWPKSEWKHDQA